MMDKRKGRFNLSWSHYQILMRIENESACRLYEIEAFDKLGGDGR